MLDTVHHRGRIVDIMSGRMSVKIYDAVKCEGCAASGLCGIDAGDNTILVATDAVEQFKVGDDVVVRPIGGTQWRAVLLALVVPCVLAILVALVALACGLSESVAALALLVSVVVYYIVLYLSRRKVEGGLKWHVESLPGI